MTNLSVNFIRDAVNKLFNDNQDYIMSRLESGISPDESFNIQINKLVSNSMLVSTEMSCLIILKIFEDLDLIAEKEHNEKPKLKLVWDSTKHQQEKK